MDDDKRRSLESHFDRLRNATPDERLRAASEQRRIALELLRGGLQARFPNLSEAEIEDRMGEIIFGMETWREMCERRHGCAAGPGPA